MTYRLPRELSRPMYNEFNYRFQEAKRVITRYEDYQTLRQDLDVVEVLLAMSIFYNRVLVNLDAATKFFGRVTINQRADAIKIGNYILNAEEVRNINRIIMSYQKLMRRYRLDDSLWNYQLTIEFLRRLINIKAIDNRGDL